MVRANQAEEARALLVETLEEDEEETWPEIAAPQVRRLT
jgi:hypothetical protein